jgi:predicted Fe-Mo cluster-binding NifX family protein
MKVCIPVAEVEGWESRVYGHFGSAPIFVQVDLDTMSLESLGNQNQAHEHGQCRPMQALAGARPDAVVVGGIGAGALLGLQQAGIKVYQGAGGTVAEVVELLQKGGLPEIAREQACGGHGEGAGCHHHG